MERASLLPPGILLQIRETFEKGGEAVIRLEPGPMFSDNSSDYWAPTYWQSLDMSDTDLGGSGPLLVDVPGATPSSLVAALGKDGNAYLLDRNNLGDIGAPVASSHVNNNAIIQAAASYRTNRAHMLLSVAIAARFLPSASIQGIHRRLRKFGMLPRAVSALHLSPRLMARITWLCGRLAPAMPAIRSFMVTMVTPVQLFSAGAEQTNKWQMHTYNTTGIVARRRIYIGTDSKVYAFKTPGGHRHQRQQGALSLHQS